MWMLQKVAFAFVALSGLMTIAAPANAQEVPAGCKTLKFVGSYTNTIFTSDVWGDGSSEAHYSLLQLNLNMDGTAIQEFSGGPDTMLSFGLSTAGVGSWKCRSDGKLVVTLIGSGYVPTTDAINHPTTVPDPPPVDLTLLSNTRTTYLFSVTDNNTLTRIQARTRRYLPAEDPSDPGAGTLRGLNTTVVIYKRVVASDADLLAP